MSKMARACQAAAHRHERASAHYRHSARRLANGEHTAAAKERDLARDLSEKARLDEIGLRPDGVAPDGRSGGEAAWHVTG